MKKKIGQDMDKALAKVGSVNLPKQEKVHTDEPLTEKDEVKQTEERRRRKIRKI